MPQIAIKKSEIDVCLILYNEEQFIETCLHRIRESFNSIVVLDMGSTDRTVEVVKDVFGAQAIVLTQPREALFDKGFAYARNKVTAAARRPWVLHIDADEFLAPHEAGSISFLAEDGCEDAARVIRRNLIEKQGISFDAASLAALATGSVEQHVRLYRPAPDVRWESFLHEEIWVGDRHAHDRAATADLVLDHVSVYRPYSERCEKELLYAWILVKVHENKDLQRNMRSYYVSEFMAENLDRFREMAREFASLHRL